MTRRRAKPKDPQIIAAERIAARAQALQAVSIPDSLAVLPRGEDVVIIREGERNGAQKAGHDMARRHDAFDALRDGMAPGAYDAARRLETDILTRMGENDRGRKSLRVDESAKDHTDRQVEAGARVKEVLAKIGPRDGWLLTELIYPTIDRGGWRETVAYVTGESNHHAQAAAVRSACANLALAYDQRKAA